MSWPGITSEAAAVLGARGSRCSHPHTPRPVPSATPAWEHPWSIYVCPSFPQRYEGVFIERTGIWEVPLFLWLEFGEREVVGLQARPSSQASGRLWGAGCQVFQSF